MVTVAVSTMYMPETKGRDLEAIGEAFAMHSVGDVPFVIGFKRLVSRFTRLTGMSHEPQASGAPTREQAIALETRVS